jgi:hypothetical protein
MIRYCVYDSNKYCFEVKTYHLAGIEYESNRIPSARKDIVSLKLKKLGRDWGVSAGHRLIADQVEHLHTTARDSSAAFPLHERLYRAICVALRSFSRGVD